MNAFIVVDNFRSALNQISYSELIRGLQNTFNLYMQCCEREDFNFEKKSPMFQQYAKLHDLMARHYGYWGYLEHRDVLIELKNKLYGLCLKPKSEIVQFYINQLEFELGVNSKIAIMEAGGVHVIRINDEA